jgi:anti-sigma regulatory factor (Ser/Thr protein kinase)
MLSPGQTFNRSYPACAESVPQARTELIEFARSAGFQEERLERIRLAASEALTNAVLHAYEKPGGTVNVSATYVPDELWLLVDDRGAGLRVRRNARGLGLGLALIAQLVDDFQILSRGTGGTELRMQFKLAPVDSWDHLERGSVSSAASPA